jgi:hypothetical protein
MANFFNGHSHATKFGDITSVFRNITASVIQGSGIGPASYIVNAADLITLLANNIFLKYADDTYLIVPAVNLASCAAELQHIEDWAQKNNLQLNRKKTACIIFTNPDSRQSVKVPEQIVPDIDIVDSLNILGVTVARNLTMSVHVNILYHLVCRPCSLCVRYEPTACHIQLYRQYSVQIQNFCTLLLHGADSLERRTGSKLTHSSPDPRNFYSAVIPCHSLKNFARRLTTNFLKLL